MGRPGVWAGPAQMLATGARSVFARSVCAASSLSSHHLWGVGITDLRLVRFGDWVLLAF